MELVLKVSEPLVKVIHLVDSDDRLAMGYLYGVIDRAKETIEANIKKKSIAFHVGGLLIKKKWDYQMHNSLHAAGYLNPRFFCSPAFFKQREIKKGLKSE